jgi:hypothetical protein
MTAHPFQHCRVSRIQIDQDVACVAVFGVRMKEHVASFAIAQAEEADGGLSTQLGRGPQPFPWEGAVGGLMNQTDQIQIVRHSRELAPDGQPSEKKSAIQHVTMLRLKGQEYNQFSANGNCVFSAVSHRRG